MVDTVQEDSPKSVGACGGGVGVASRNCGAVRPRIQPNDLNFDVTTATDTERTIHETFLKFRTGHLTAIVGSDVPMTVSRVTARGIVETMHFNKRKLIRGEYRPDLLIGSGPELVFANGAFVRAQ